MRNTCEICDDTLHFRWTDTHGIGACMTCGATYRIYHYEGNKRVDREPSITLKPEWVDLHRRAYADLKCNVFPGAYNIPGSSYEVATKEEARRVDAWFKKRKDEWPEDSE